MRNCRTTSLFATQSSAPVADAADRIITQTLGTRIFPTDDASNFHFGAGYEFSARQWVREIALIQTFNYASIVQYDLYLPNSNGNEKNHFKRFNL